MPISSAKLCYTPLNSAEFCQVVKMTNHDFPYLVWKIAISSLSASALAQYLFQAYSDSNLYRYLPQNIYRKKGLTKKDEKEKA